MQFASVNRQNTLQNSIFEHRVLIKKIQTKSMKISIFSSLNKYPPLFPGWKTSFFLFWTFSFRCFLLPYFYQQSNLFSRPNWINLRKTKIQASFWMWEKDMEYCRGQEEIFILRRRSWKISSFSSKINKLLILLECLPAFRYRIFSLLSDYLNFLQRIELERIP